MGKEVGSTKSTGFPTLGQMSEAIGKQLADPFYDRGPNDKGIGVQLAYSLGRVGLGFSLAALLAIPLGFVRHSSLPQAPARNAGPGTTHASELIPRRRRPG